MNRRKWTVWLGAILLVMLVVTGYFAIAAEYGSKEDPLVSLSYINDVLSPQTMDEINKAFETKKTEFDAQINTRLQAASADIDVKIQQYKDSLSAGSVSDDVISAIADQVIEKMQSGVGSSSGGESNWAVIRIEPGKTLTAEVGCEMLLRIGGATCVASGTPGLINLTTAADLANGGALAINNLYIVTVKGRGLKAGSAGCTILVNGSYTIS